MILNLKEKSLESAEKQFFYGAKVNKNIKDAYLGYGFLEPNETNRKEGPSKGHEEIVFLLEGEIKINFKEKSVVLKEGEVIHLPDKSEVTFDNLNSERSTFLIAGGHTKRLLHSH